MRRPKRGPNYRLGNETANRSYFFLVVLNGLCETTNRYNFFVVLNGLCKTANNYKYFTCFFVSLNGSVKTTK